MPHVRLAAIDDARLLARLGAELFAQAFAARNRPEDLRQYLQQAFSESKQRTELEDPAVRTWIAEDDDGTAIGYAQLRLRAHPRDGALDEPAELARIYSDARWHGRGVGAALLAACVGAAVTSGARQLWLGVWQENPRGIAFYEKNGFRIIGTQTFQVGTDAQKDWIMVRDLRPSDTSSAATPQAAQA